MTSLGRRSSIRVGHRAARVSVPLPAATRRTRASCSLMDQESDSKDHLTLWSHPVRALSCTNPRPPLSTAYSISNRLKATRSPWSESQISRRRLKARLFPQIAIMKTISTKRLALMNMTTLMMVRSSFNPLATNSEAWCSCDPWHSLMT